MARFHKLETPSLHHPPYHERALSRFGYALYVEGLTFGIRFVTNIEAFAGHSGKSHETRVSPQPPSSRPSSCTADAYVQLYHKIAGHEAHIQGFLSRHHAVRYRVHYPKPLRMISQHMGQRLGRTRLTVSPGNIPTSRT